MLKKNYWMFTILCICGNVHCQLSQVQCEVADHAADIRVLKQSVDKEIEWFIDYGREFLEDNKSVSTELGLWEKNQKQFLDRVESLEKMQIAFEAFMKAKDTALYELHGYSSITSATCVVTDEASLKWFKAFVEENFFPQDWERKYAEYEKKLSSTQPEAVN